VLHCDVQGGYSLTLTLPEDDRYFADKLDILERNGLGASASFSLVRGQEPTPEMMGVLRLMQLNGRCLPGTQRAGVLGARALCVCV
jgi:hypothetical protein